MHRSFQITFFTFLSLFSFSYACYKPAAPSTLELTMCVINHDCTAIDTYFSQPHAMSDEDYKQLLFFAVSRAKDYKDPKKQPGFFNGTLATLLKYAPRVLGVIAYDGRIETEAFSEALLTKNDEALQWLRLLHGTPSASRNILDPHSLKKVSIDQFNASQMRKAEEQLARATDEADRKKIYDEIERIKKIELFLKRSPGIWPRLGDFSNDKSMIKAVVTTAKQAVALENLAELKRLLESEAVDREKYFEKAKKLFLIALNHHMPNPEMVDYLAEIVAAHAPTPDSYMAILNYEFKDSLLYLKPAKASLLVKAGVHPDRAFEAFAASMEAKFPHNLPIKQPSDFFEQAHTLPFCTAEECERRKVYLRKLIVNPSIVNEKL